MDFLTFKTFISINVLIIFYYLGSIIFPFVFWHLLKRFVIHFKAFFFQYAGEAFTEQVENTVKDIVWNTLKPAQRKKVIAVFVVLFIFFELFWRMLFEFLIAYMQIRDALVSGS